MSDSNRRRRARATCVLLLLATSALSTAGGSHGANAAEPGITGLHGVEPTRILDTRVGLGAPARPVGAAGSLDLQVTDVAGVPASGVSAVVLNVTATEGTAPSFVTVFPTGEQRPEASNLNFGPGVSVPNLVIAKVGVGGNVRLFNRFGSVHLIADISAYYDDDAQLVPLSPRRIVDTRTGLGGIEGPFDGTRTVQVAGRAGVPPQGASAAILNVTAVDPAQAGFVTLHPAGTARGSTSNLNIVAGITRPNLAIVQLGSGGQIDVYSLAQTDLVIDVLGYETAPPNLTDVLEPVAGSGGGPRPTTSDFDEVKVNGTRPQNSLVDCCVSSSAEWTEFDLGGAWQTLGTTFTFDDNDSVSSANVRFRILGDGEVLADETVAFGDSVPVTVDVSGVLRLRFETSDVSMTVDASTDTYAVFLDPKLSDTPIAPQHVDFNAISPRRILDTRTGRGAAQRKVQPGEVIELQVLGNMGISNTGVGAVAVNLTVTETEGPGYVQAFPTGSPKPSTSNVNYDAAGQSVSNFAILPVGPKGRISISPIVSGTHIVVDVAGYYPGTASSARVKFPSGLMTKWLRPVWSNEGPGLADQVSVNGNVRHNSLLDCCVSASPGWTEFNLSRAWQTLSTTFTFDDYGAPSANVRFRILGDGEVLADETVAFGDSVPVTVDVSGVLRVRFETTGVGTSGDADAVFVDPKLSQ